MKNGNLCSNIITYTYFFLESLFQIQSKLHFLHRRRFLPPPDYRVFFGAMMEPKVTEHMSKGDIV